MTSSRTGDERWASGRWGVAGMGRSGVAVAEALVQAGATVVVLDERPAETPERLTTVEHLQGRGVDVLTGWHGRLAGLDLDGLVASPGFRREHPALRDAAEQGIPVWSEVELAYRLARDPILAITGTNGKSTTTVLLWLLLRAAGVDAVLCGNIAGSGYPELTLTEAAVATGEGDTPRMLVAEVSSYQLEHVHTFRPRVATVLNVTPDHQERHPTFQDYFDTKMRLFAAMGDGDVAVTAWDEPSTPPAVIEPYLPKGVGLRVWGEAPDEDRGQATASQTWVSDEAMSLGGRRLSRSDFPNLAGPNARNAATAWEMATAALGPIDDATALAMLRALAEFRGLAHRMERLGEHGGITWINNSMCTNPAALVASSQSVPGAQFLLLGGYPKDLDYGPVRAWLQVSGHRAALFNDAEDGVGARLGLDLPRWDSLEDAVAWATEQAQPGDTILLAPGAASRPPYADFRARGDHFRRLFQEHTSA